MHASVCDYLADTVQNSIEAGASLVEVNLVEDGRKVEVAIRDNGKGMDAETLKRVWDPFYSEAGKHDKRRVGLGLPLLRQLVESVGGSLSLDSKVGEGTSLRYGFPADHIDAPPMGDVPWTLVSLFNYTGEFELSFSHTKREAGYTISRSELQDALGNLHDASNLVLMRDFLREQENDLNN